MNNKNCIFCKIINKEIESKIIHESVNFIAILDAFPKSPGHTLIIPKIHSENIFEFDSRDGVKLLDFIKETKNLIEKNFGVKDFFIRTNIGKESGQIIFHTHIHLVPSYHIKKELSIDQVYKKLKNN